MEAVILFQPQLPACRVRGFVTVPALYLMAQCRCPATVETLARLRLIKHRVFQLRVCASHRYLSALLVKFCKRFVVECEAETFGTLFQVLLDFGLSLGRAHLSPSFLVGKGRLSRLALPCP